MVVAVSIPEPYVYMMGAEDLISNLEASSPSIEAIEVFNPCSRPAKPQRWSSSKSQHGLATGITSPMVADEHRPIISIKRGLSKTLRSLGAVKPRRTRSVRGLLSDMFRTKIEEIIQPEDREGNDMAQGPKVQRPSAAGNYPHNYYTQARKRCHPAKGRGVCTLEPISEVSSVVTFSADNIPELENVFLQSTECAPAAAFRHGPIRLHKLDLMSRQELNVTADRDSSDYKAALSRTAYHWFYDNYESQQQEEFNEVGDLIDWWESWGIEDPGDLTPDEPLSPSSTTGDSFPYSDTTSENSTSSGYPDSGYFPKYSWEYELHDTKRASANELSNGNVRAPSLEVAEDLDGNPREMYEYDYIRSIAV